MNDFNVSSNFFGGYNKKEVDDYCNYLRNLLEDSRKEQEAIRQELNNALEENGVLEKKLAEAEGCYRGLWEKCQGQEDALSRQHQLLVQLTDKNQPIQPISQRLDQWKKKYIDPLNIGGGK